MLLDMPVNVIGIQQDILAADSALVVNHLKKLILVSGISEHFLVLAYGELMIVLGVGPQVIQGDWQLADFAECLDCINHVIAKPPFLGFSGIQLIQLDILH